MKRDRYGVVRLAGALLLPFGVWGCPGTIGGGGGNGGGVINGATDGNRDTTLTSPAGKTSGEPNDSFGDPIIAVLNQNGVAALQGTVSRKGDLDVFAIGPMNAGDRLVVDVNTTGSVLDSSVGIFDAQGRLAYENDDRGGSEDRFLDSFIDFTVRRSSDEYYMVVTNAAFADPADKAGSYLVDVTITRGSVVPGTKAQVLFLDFEGGQITSPVLGPQTLLPFDAADIHDPGSFSRPYVGQTEALKQSIVETVVQNFERFDVDVVSSDDPPIPAGVEFSTVYIGGFNARAFGEAESVDLYNADYCDDAIIYAESFVPGIFSVPPSVQQLGVAIGNVTAHEAGHLLGLNHVDDDTALMDDRSAADAFLDDQEFKNADLSSDIMTIGTQDAALLLDETVGPSAF